MYTGAKPDIIGGNTIIGGMGLAIGVAGLLATGGIISG